MSNSNSALQRTYVELYDGTRMPIIGFGTGHEKPTDGNVEMYRAVKVALEAGYRSIDTAFLYQVERGVGKAIREAIDNGTLRSRDDVFVTSKLPSHGNRPSEVKGFLRKSLDDLQLDYVDLYLIHWPLGYAVVGEGDPRYKRGQANCIIDASTDIVAVWKKMEEMVDEGLAKYIGLPNFNEEQIGRILEICRIRPANLQVECHAYLQQTELSDFCRKNGITVTGYAPLRSPGFRLLVKNAGGKDLDYPTVLDEPAVKSIAAKCGKTSSQVLLRFLTLKGIVVIPKSTNPDRIRENLDIFNFTLAPEDVEVIERLGERNFRIFDLRICPGLDKHPEYPF